MYVRGYLQGSVNGRVVTIEKFHCDRLVFICSLSRGTSQGTELVSLDWMRLDSALQKVAPDISRPKKSRHYFDALDEREIGR
jgi:hypothetical protein